MSLLNPFEAPVAHVEMLPPSSIAAEAAVATGGAFNTPRITITTWAPGESEMYGEGSSESPDDWAENNCDSCRYHTEEFQHSADDQVVDTSEGELTIIGTFYTNSPCPCYDEGISAVSFPCVDGLEGPDDGSDECDLSTRYLKYKAGLNLSINGTVYPYNQYVTQQGCEVRDDVVYVGWEGNVVNTYSGDNHVCWGENYAGDTLCENEAVYTMSEANEDLTSFSTHQDDAHRIKRGENDIIRAYACPTPDSLDDLGKGLAVAKAGPHTSAFMIMATNGAVINGSLASLAVYMYPQVAIDDDTIINVWATDPLPTGKRLLFSQVKEDGVFRTVLLGAVDQDFNLTKCVSTVAPSLEQAAQDNSLSPAC